MQPVHAQVGLQVEAGLDGYGRVGRWAPVRVTATNNGSPVTGRLVVGMPGGETALPLELPLAANKRIATLLVPQPPYDASFSTTQERAVAGLRDGRREVARAEARLRLLPGSPRQLVPGMSRLLAVCSGEASGLRFLDNVPLADAGWAMPPMPQGGFWAGKSFAAQLQPDQMPPEAAGWDAADLLVLRDAAWQQMEPQQRRAVRQWVEGGGRLILCGEDPGGFQDEEGRRLLPVEPTGRRPRPALAAFPLPDRAPIRAEAGKVSTVTARPRPGAVVALREAGAPMVVRQNVGFGLVLWVGFDPFRVPPGLMATRRAFWAYLINQASGAIVTDPAFPRLADVPAATEPLKHLPHFPTPSRWTLASFGLVYALVFGPLNIWLLRRLRRTVRAWLLMPALSLGMTGGVLALGNLWGKAQIVFHTTSVLEAMAGSRTAWEENLAALFSPTNRAFRLEIEDPAPSLQRLPPEGDVADPSRATPGSQGVSAALMPVTREGDLCRWDSIGLTLWTIELFQTERLADLGGEVRIELNDRLTGRVINQTPHPLRDAYLQYHGWRCPLGEIAPGATALVPGGNWKRRREAEAESSASRYPASGSPRFGPTSTAPAGEGADDLWAIAGSLLRDTTGRSEVVLVAHAPGLMLPVRFTGIPRSGTPGLSDHSLLLIRQPVVSPLNGVPGGR
jgi:hypothetical protein